MRIGQRLLILLCGVLVTAGIGAGLFWNYAYRSQIIPPKQDVLPSLTAPAFVHSGSNGATLLEAENLHDAIRALGYAHALKHPWTMAVSRQAATGQLSAWFDVEALASDQLARQLGFRELAETALKELPAEDHDFLEAYVDGVNAAWPMAKSRAEFLLLELDPPAWEMWHILAIERLLAWLSEPVLEGCLPEMTLCLADRTLRTVLHVHGFEHSLAWVMSGGDRTVFYQRHITGAAASPVYQEITLRIAGWQPIRGASIIGTPFFPAARSDSSAWALLPSSPRSLIDSTSYEPEFARITAASGNEHLISYSRTDSLLSIAGQNSALKWHGLLPQTDLGAWRALLERAPANFKLLRGDGIHVDAHQNLRVSGRPHVHASSQRGLLIGNRPEAESIAEYIRTSIDPTPNVEIWTRDLRSSWSAAILPDLLSSIETPAAENQAMETAVAYLQNWDHQYQGFSIGATIYSEWMRTRAPDPQVALTQAVDQLTRRFGPVQSSWRWDRVHSEQRFFILPSSMQIGQFAPLSWLARGHSTTLVWGGETMTGEAVPPASWEMWMDLSPSAPVYIRRRHIDLSIPLGRSIAEAAVPVVFGIPTATRHSTTLIP